MVRLTSVSSEKPLHWVGSSKKDFLAFPEPVQSNMGYALGVVQLGGKPPKAKYWKGNKGQGTFELVEDYSGDTFRVIYTVHFARVVYVLHAFQKKSKSRIKTPKSDVDLAGERMKRAARHYTENVMETSPKGKDYE